MKKIGIIVACLLLCCCFGCGKKLTTYTEIDYEQYIKKLDNKETFPLVIGSSDCSACAMFKVTMETFIKKYQVEVFYVDLSKFDAEDYNSLKLQTSFDGTPTTVFISKGELTSFYNRLDGTEDLNSVVNFLNNNNYID